MINPSFYRRQRNYFLFLSSMLIFNLNAQQIAYQVPVDSTSVGKILLYNLCQSVQNDMEFINRKINDRVYMEIHLGAAYYKNSHESAILGVKLNVINPKLPFYNSIKAKTFKIRRVSKILNGGLDSISSNKLNEIESYLAEYDRDKWKRFSISMTAPVTLLRYDTLYSWNPVDSAYRYRVSSYFNPSILRVFGFSLGYDIGDIATVNIGSTFEYPRQIYGSVTFDVSTPTYLVVNSFLNQLKYILYPNIPSSPNIENVY
jgi:hypothetical protein